MISEDPSAKEDLTNSQQPLKVYPYKRGYSHPPIIIMKQLSLIREESSTGCDVTDDCTVETGLLPAKIKIEKNSSTNNDSDFNPDEIIQILVMESERKSLDNPIQQSELKSLLDNNLQSHAETKSEIQENTNLPGDYKSVGSSNQSSANSSPQTGFKPRTSIRRSFKERSDISRLSRDKRRRRCASETCEIDVINAALAEVHKKESKKRLSLPNMPQLRRGSMSSSSSSSSILSRYEKFLKIFFCFFKKTTVPDRFGLGGVTSFFVF